MDGARHSTQARQGTRWCSQAGKTFEAFIASVRDTARSGDFALVRI
jgi:hypothetical protein